MVKRLFVHQTSSYFIKAILIMLCLMLVSNIAPYLPAALLPLIFIVYATIATIGALYYTFTHRLHRQKKLVEEGHLSRLNRKWVWRMVGMLIAGIVSAFFFVLESPKWDSFEWALIWLAIPLYYVVYLVLQRYLKMEFAPRYYKAHAMRWSFLIVGALLCLLYAVLSSLLPSTEYATLAEAFQGVPRPYEHAFSALMQEVEKLSSFADGLTSFGVSQMSQAGVALGFVFRLVAYASVFFGLVSQFSFCLLNKTEIKNEFQILPSYDEDEPTGPICRRYIVAFVAVSVIMYGAFLCLEFEATKAQATEEYTVIDTWVNEQSENLILLVDGEFQTQKEQAELRKNIKQQINKLIDERNAVLLPLIDEYYDQCRSNVDAYLDWLDSPAGFFTKHLKFMGNLVTDVAKDAFFECVTDGADGDALEKCYRDYQDQIAQLREQGNDVLTGSDLQELLGIDLSHPGTNEKTSLDLWQPLSGEDNVSVIDSVLLNTDENQTQEECRARILRFINEARLDTLQQAGITLTEQDRL